MLSYHCFSREQSHSCKKNLLILPVSCGRQKHHCLFLRTHAVTWRKKTRNCKRTWTRLMLRYTPSVNSLLEVKLFFSSKYCKRRNNLRTNARQICLKMLKVTSSLTLIFHYSKWKLVLKHQQSQQVSVTRRRRYRASTAEWKHLLRP